MKNILLPDMHIPEHDQRSWDAVLKYISDAKPDVVTQLGDFMTMDCISDKASLWQLESKRLAKDYKKGNEVLDELESAAPQARKVWIEGNHEERVLRLIGKAPQLEGIVEVPINLRLAERGIEWVPFWSKGKLAWFGKYAVGHGIYTNEHHAKKHVMAFDCNLFYGHAHDHQVFCKVNAGDNDTKMAMSCGCLCKYKQHYMKGRPNRWQQMIVEVNSDKFFTSFPIAIFNHSFIAPNGRLYKG